MKNNTYRLLLVACCLSLVAGLFAKGPGTTTASFLKIAIGAKNIAMGETGATSDDVNAIYWNPAGVSRFSSKQISLMHAIWLEEINYSYLAYAHPTSIGTFGLGLSYLYMSEIKKYDMHDNPLNETYRPFDIAVTICYARKLNFGSRTFDIGLNLKYISSKLDDETPPAYAFAADLGSLYHFTTIPLSVGLVVQNIGTQMKFINEADPLPLNIKLGCSYPLLVHSRNHLLASLDINKPIDNDFRINFGTEYTHKFGKDLMFSVRVGYKTNIKGLRVIDGICSGVGLRFKEYSLDYAFTPYGDLGSTHRVSVIVRFGK